MSFRKHFMRNWFAIEAIPLYIIVGGVVFGSTYYLSRLALGPDVVWTKANPTPWNSIKQDETPKFTTINQTGAKKWRRDKL